MEFGESFCFVKDKILSFGANDQGANSNKNGGLYVYRQGGTVEDFRRMKVKFFINSLYGIYFDCSYNFLS